MNTNRAILPGSTLGVVGGGQLGRMFAIAAQRLGYRVHVYAPDADPPAAQVACQHIRGEYGDIAALSTFARDVSAITYEFENVPADAMFTAEKYAPVRPGPHVLRTTQHRRREKEFLHRHGIPVAPFHPVDSAETLDAAMRIVGAPAVLKTAEAGYDGKGQVRIDRIEDAESAWVAIGRTPSVCEAWVEFRAELSVVVARGLDGHIETYGPFANTHERHILDTTVFPADVPPKAASNAIEIARHIVESLDVVGVLCVEMFLLDDDRLLVNELAPRPHNSGHLTIDAHMTSQFEQQVRAMCAAPLGNASPRCAAAMANLLGDAWAASEPAWEQVLARPDVRLHLYGKGIPRSGRKMGHLTALADDPETALRRALDARRSLAADSQHPSVRQRA